MNKDPYRILGVPYDATDEQIKSAYRDLARRNHPDNFTDPSSAAAAEERMKQINEAMDAIRRMRAGRGEGADRPRSSSPRLNHIRAMIRAGDFDGAEQALSAIPAEEQGGEWNFLKGCVLTQKGWYYDAQKHLQTACYMDPDNPEYRELLSNIRAAAGTYGRGYRSDAPGKSNELCDICMSLACLDCMCDCCGGDFIRCC